jgi:hypothetical protein
LAWDLGVETVAKGIELGGELAQAVSDGLKAIKETDWYKNLNDDLKNKADISFNDHFKDYNKRKIDVTKDFADKKSDKFTTEEVRAIWQYAIDHYIDKGVTDFSDMISSVSKETGLSIKQVREAITQPKSLYKVTDEMYKIRGQRTKAIQNSKMWLKSANTPPEIKFFKALPRIFFGAKVFGHGTVGGMSHAGMYMFKPSSWKRYFPYFINQFKLAYGKDAYFQKYVEDLKNEPDYIFWKRNELAVDPDKIQDDYLEFGKYFGRLGVAGDRGFTALKGFRLQEARAIWSHLSDVEKADKNTAKEIARIVNHSTGTSKVVVPNSLAVAIFAPRLEASRWARLIAQPTKALMTYRNWKNASTADKVAAKLVSKRSGEMIATYFGLLCANYAINTLSGNKNKVNLFDPTKGDWWLFKAGNKSFDISGGMRSTTRFVAHLMTEMIESHKNLRGNSRSGEIFKTVGKYARGKASPFMGTAVDFAFQADYFDRPLWYSKDKPRKGDKRYTFWEYVLENQTPIPVAEGIKDVHDAMISKGISTVQAKQIIEGVFIAAIVGGTGARVSEYATKGEKSTYNPNLPVRDVKTETRDNNNTDIRNPQYPTR